MLGNTTREHYSRPMGTTVLNQIRMTEFHFAAYTHKNKTLVIPWTPRPSRDGGEGVELASRQLRTFVLDSSFYSLAETRSRSKLDFDLM